MQILRTSLLTTPGGRKAIQTLAAQKRLIASGRLMTRIATNGCLQFNLPDNNTVNITFYHELLSRRFSGQSVEIEINDAIAPHRTCLLRFKGHDLPVLAFFLDENNQPYYFVNSLRDRASTEDIRLYPVDLGNEPISICGMQYIKAHEQITNYVNIAVANGQFLGAYSYFLAPLGSTPLLDTQLQPKTILVGTRTSEAPLNLKLTGYYGPIKLAAKTQKNSVAHYFFPARAERTFTISPEDLQALGVQQKDGAFSISAYFEHGLPIRIYSPEDTEFKNPLYFRVIRDKNWKIIDVGRERTRNTNFSGIVIIEAIQTSLALVDGNRKGPLEVAILGKRKFTLEILDKEMRQEDFLSRRVSVIRVDNDFTLFMVPGPAFEGINKEIAELAIAAYELQWKIPPEEIKRVAAIAYEAHQANQTDAFDNAIRQLRDWTARERVLSVEDRYKAYDEFYGQILAQDKRNSHTILRMARALICRLEHFTDDLAGNKARRLFAIKAAYLKQQAKQYLEKLGLKI